MEADVAHSISHPLSAAIPTGPTEPRRDFMSHVETARHHQFQATKANRREWFHPSAELIEHINSLRETPLTAVELAA